ncbi:MAG: response regulator [Mangrovibacterium sp.]
MTKKLQILVAEDVESNYLYLKAVLKKMNANIIWVKNGQEAIDMVDENPNIDLILMDMLMPNVNGFEATATIKMTHPEIKIVAQTAFAMHEDREKALACGCDAYLAKPIRAEDLLQMVRMQTVNKK